MSRTTFRSEVVGFCSPFPAGWKGEQTMKGVGASRKPQLSFDKALELACDFVEFARDESWRADEQRNLT